MSNWSPKTNPLSATNSDGFPEKQCTLPEPAFRVQIHEIVHDIIHPRVYTSHVIIGMLGAAAEAKYKQDKIYCRHTEIKGIPLCDISHTAITVFSHFDFDNSTIFLYRLLQSFHFHTLTIQCRTGTHMGGIRIYFTADIVAPNRRNIVYVFRRDLITYPFLNFNGFIVEI